MQGFLLKLFSILPTGLVHGLSQMLALVRNGPTLGVRVLVVDSERQEILLVRHTYLRGWYLPGGGVERGETIAEAAVREVREELGVNLSGAPDLMGIYLNRKGLGRDHVALLLASSWASGNKYLEANEEIAEARVFSLNGLPEDLSPASRARIEAYRSGAFAGGQTKMGEWNPVVDRAP
ncbi:NUDIX domain-containing protein [Roseibium sp.]|uniref:NUDIX domain-containing protein n=1 Tax=Roseibium sp. TaxID=1936156 RepID=UPI003A973A84